MSSADMIVAALVHFAVDVQAKLSQVTHGEPEDQLRAPFEQLMNSVAASFNLPLVLTGETPLPDRLGRPDYAVHVHGALVGYVELKAPGVGASASRFRGRNKQQFQRFAAVPNMLYADGNEWALYRSGELIGRVMRLDGDIVAEGGTAVTPQAAAKLTALLHEFLGWTPFIPQTKGRIDLRGFAELLAPLCRMLRDDVRDALANPRSPLVHLAADWRQLLFPDASDEQFADAYAQTVTFALLLGRSEGADPLSLQTAERVLAAQHSLLSRALEVLTDRAVRLQIGASLDLVERVIAAVPPASLSLSPTDDPWLYFYEDFLAVYDPELRKAAGAYYTPVEVVRAQVRMIDDVLRFRLGKSLGFADPSVTTLDPALGTGTYLLGVIDHALHQVQVRYGAGVVPGHATDLAHNVYGFELMVGPYAVSELRVTRALQDYGARLPADGTHIYLTDTLESPQTTPGQSGFYYRVMADQHAKALEIKQSKPIVVCLGNPPYDRHAAAHDDNRAGTGGWVRWGEEGTEDTAILESFLAPTKAAGYGGHLKNVYNLYVYFWRWALWKVFEQAPELPGIVSFITASSYLDGAAFVGMREHLRRVSDTLWIIDLGGEGRGTRKEENVFNIQTPVAICMAFRAGAINRDQPATVYFKRITGSRAAKLAALDAITNIQAVDWQACPTDWHAPFRPAGKGLYFAWPLLTDLMPWQHSGVQLKRTWPIAPDKDTLERRWQALLQAPDRAVAFKESRDREISSQPAALFDDGRTETPLERLSRDAPLPVMQGYAYRSFDRQWMFADNRLGDYLRPDLWRVYSSKQVYFSSLLTKDIGKGMAITVTSYLPDLDHFSGRGAKDTVPLYRNAEATEPNLHPDILETLGATYGRKLSAEDVASYIYGVLAQPAFTATFHDELASRELRVPLTKDGALFEQARTLGARLIFLHTYGERFAEQGNQTGQIIYGRIRALTPVPNTAEGYPENFEYDESSQTLYIGAGSFGPVAPEIYYFEVSGLKVVQSWLGYRMKAGKGKKSSPLDDIRPQYWTSQFTAELMELLLTLEQTIQLYPEQAQLLEAIIAGPCFSAEDFNEVPDELRKPPKPQQPGGQIGMEGL